MGVEISGEGGVRQLVLFLKWTVTFSGEKRMSEDAPLRKEPLNEFVPVTEIIFSLGALYRNRS